MLLKKKSLVFLMVVVVGIAAYFVFRNLYYPITITELDNGRTVSVNLRQPVLIDLNFAGPSYFYGTLYHSRYLTFKKQYRSRPPGGKFKFLPVERGTSIIEIYREPQGNGEPAQKQFFVFLVIE